MTVLRCAMLWSLALALMGSVMAQTLQTFTIKDYLRHQWTDEIVQFPIAYRGELPPTLTLTDPAGVSLPCQLTGLSRKGGKVTGTAWTVVSLPPKGEVTLHLRAGQSAPSDLRLRTEGEAYLLGNAHLTLRIPRLPGALAQPVDLTALPAPLLAVSDQRAAVWYGQGRWVNAGEPLRVKEAVTSIVEEGPVRVTVRYRLTFTDNRYYQADITLGARQDVALFTDETDMEAPTAAFRFSFQPGLGADRIYWRNNWFADQAKGLVPAPIDFTKEQVLCHMRPWSYWWAKDLTISVGFFQEGAEPFIGVMTMRPSRWTPYGWDAVERTQIPVTARPGGQLDLNLALLAWTYPKADPSKVTPIEAIGLQYWQDTLAKQNGSDGALTVMPMHRELGITVGSVTEHVTKADTTAKLRRQLVKYSQFPLDDVKEFAFDYRPAKLKRAHPFLLFTQADIDRTRRQAVAIPALKEEIARALKQVNARGMDRMLAKIQSSSDGWQTFYREDFLAGALHYGAAAEAFIGSDDERYGVILAAGLKGMARMNVKDILDAPWRPDLGGYAHVYPGNWTRLLFAYDAIADAGYLTDEDKADIDAALVLGAHVLAHPDYWNPARGLCSANPNMTALITLPRGLMALYLDGHPRADRWLKSAEDELQAELKAWIAPGGAWIECPGYQGASLDPMLPLMQALKNVKGRNYFADPRFKATMDYYGFLLTPPDRRFPPNNTAGLPSPRILPSLGDMWTGATTVFTGWTAKAIADADPVFGARQQYHWQQQLMPHGTMYSSGYTPALTNPELPAAPPVELSRAFPGMGSVMRSSWTDPNASYLLHRTGEFMHHYHDDFNSLIYYAKGAPLCADFGNLYQPHQRGEAWYHSRVSFNAKDNPPSQANQSTGRLVETCFLPRTLDYSHGQSAGVGKQTANRHLLLVKSADPMGATYVVMRDATTDGPNEREFYWNLWCLSKEPQIAGNVVRFPGQLGVGLDVHLLSPATPKLEIDKWDWKQYIGTWGNFTEEQYGLHVHKTGSAEDYVAVLYPRSAGQGPARVRAEASVVNARGNAQVLTITHMEGEDTILFSPQADALHFGKAELAGRIAFVRRYQNGALRLATVSGKCAVTLDEWSLHSDGPTAIEIIGKQVTGESNGAAHAAQIVLPAATGAVTATLDGKRIRVKREKNVVSLNLPAGAHTFTLAVK